jgi:hypothetical protein
MMARLLMGSHFTRAFCPRERFSQTAIGEMMRAALISQNNEVEPTRSRRKKREDAFPRAKPSQEGGVNEA